MQNNYLVPLLLSLKISSVATLVVSVIGIPMGYFLAFQNFRFKTIIETFILLPLVLPPTVVGYYLIFALGRDSFFGNLILHIFNFSFLFTWQGAALASTVVALPLVVKTSQSAFESIDVKFIEISYSLGYSKFETLFKTLLPLAKGNISGGIVLAFTRCLGEFGATLMVAGNIPESTATLPLTIYSLATAGLWREANTMAMVLAFTSLAFLIVARVFHKSAF